MFPITIDKTTIRMAKACITAHKFLLQSLCMSDKGKRRKFIEIIDIIGYTTLLSIYGIMRCYAVIVRN